MIVAPCLSSNAKNLLVDSLSTIEPKVWTGVHSSLAIVGINYNDNLATIKVYSRVKTLGVRMFEVRPSENKLNIVLLRCVGLASSTI